MLWVFAELSLAPLPQHPPAKLLHCAWLAKGGCRARADAEGHSPAEVQKVPPSISSAANSAGYAQKGRAEIMHLPTVDTGGKLELVFANAETDNGTI